MDFRAIFNFSLFKPKSPEERQSAELSAFEKQAAKISVKIEDWLENAAFRQEQHYESLDDDDGDDEEVPLPVFRREFNLKSLTPAHITHDLIGTLQGVTDLREAAGFLESQFVLEVAGDKPHARLILTIDPNKPHAESRVALALAVASVPSVPQPVKF